MSRTAWLIVFSAIVATLLGNLGGSTAGQKPNFDKLNDTDRKVLGEQFKKEVWPLLTREGKDGCVGCHNGKVVSALKFSGDADKDFRMLLKDGFFVKDDPGSLLSRIEDRNKKRMMPPPDKGRPWTADEKKVLEGLVNAIDKKQK